MSLRRLLVSISAFPLIAIAHPAQAEWIEAKSTHFTLVGDMSDDLVRRRIERLERFDAAMRQVVPKSTQPNLPIMMVGGTEDVRKLVRRDGVLAFFVPSPFGVFAVSPVSISSDYRINAETVLFHEYVHHMLMGSLDQAMPRWMGEGMAELFMNTKLESDGGVIIGMGNEARGYSLNRISRWTVERLFESDTRPPVRDDVDQLYAKGWLTLHYLLFSGKRPGQFTQFTEALRRGVPQMQAAKDVFGDLGKLESELEFYRRRSNLPAVRISAEALKADTQATIRKLGPDEAEIMPLRLRSMVGVDAEAAQDVWAKAQPIGAKYPNSAFVQRALAEMAYDAKFYDQADAAIGRALAAEPDNVSMLSYKGFLLGNRAARDGRKEDWKAARAVIVKANRLDPNNPLPFVLFFDSYVASGSPPPKGAVDGLLRAIVLQPSFQGLRTRVGLRLIAAGEVAQARELLAPVAFAPHTDPESPVAKLVAEIDKGTRGDALDAKIKELKVGFGNLFEPPPSPSEGKDDGTAKAP